MSGAVGVGKAVAWRERLRRYERSGVTVAKFCQREGVSVPSFYQWRRRLAEASPSPRQPRSTAGPGPPAAAFQQVLLSGGGVVSVELPSGVRIELPAQQASLVRAVVADLLQAEAGGCRGDV